MFYTYVCANILDILMPVPYRNAIFQFAFWCGSTFIFGIACHRKPVPENPEIWKKIQIDFRRLDENGLTGPIGGKVAVNYEFCLPANEKYWKKIKQVDQTAQKQPGAKGRVGCDGRQWLVIGSTHQPNYRRVLYELAALPYIDRILQTFWE